MNTKNAEKTLIVLIVILLAIASFLYATDAGASVDTGRPDACRTYNVQFTFKGVENEDHKPCGPADYKRAEKDNKPADTVVPVVTVVPDVPATDDTPAVTETPETPETPARDDTPDDKPADNTKGNPGNDKPVGNAGEKCDKSMCENADGKTGEHGKSKND